MSIQEVNCQQSWISPTHCFHTVFHLVFGITVYYMLNKQTALTPLSQLNDSQTTFVVNEPT